MAEGIDQAADAFAKEISPSPDRPRDDGGRFTGTSRPEPLFESRDLEGDDKGDTRDGGEDPRLAAIERRIADGRAEEGDAGELARISDAAAARARHADGQGQHRRADAEPAGSEGQKPDGEDTEGPDEGADAEGASEQDAESARWALTHDGKPVEKIEIDVGGETKQVSLTEVVKGYAEQETINQRARQVEETIRTFEQQSTAVAQEIGQARQTYQERLAYIGRVMADLYPKELNWEQEYAADPRQARDKEKVYQHVRGRMTAIAQEMQREQAEAQAQVQAQSQWEAQRLVGYIEDGKKEFLRRAGLRNDSSAQDEYQQMRKFALEVYGFSDHEVGTIYDPRMLQVLHDASRWRRETASKPRPVSPDQGRTMAPGASRPFAASGARRRIDDALKTQQRNGGSIDATAAVFERLLK